MTISVGFVLLREEGVDSPSFSQTKVIDKNTAANLSLKSKHSAFSALQRCGDQKFRISVNLNQTST